MERCAVFVDAGYLLASGGLACCGTKHRAQFDCDYPSLVDALCRYAEDSTRMPMLRLYWYDGAPDAIPLADHLGIAKLNHVKLRLGRLTRGEQKGVDSLIIRDLMTLARERAIATALLVSGDEDLREGVAAAQDMGVRVVLIGIPGSGSQKYNQADTLVREADEYVVQPKEYWQAFFTHKTPVPAARVIPENEEGPLVDRIGAEFAATWGAGATREETVELLAKLPSIPKELDVQLLRAAETQLGGLRERHELKRQLREAFWRELQRLG